MIDSVSGLTGLAVSLQQQKLSNEVSAAVLKKAQDVQEQQGAAALQLLEAARIPQGIDIRA